MQFDGSDGMWHGGGGAFAIGSAFERRRDFVGPALPILRRLRDGTRETANLGIVDEGGGVSLTQVRAARSCGRSPAWVAARPWCPRAWTRPSERLAALGDTVREAARELTEALGGALPAEGAAREG